MAVQSSPLRNSTAIPEPLPFSGDLRVKVFLKSNDYDRMHQLFITKVDASGQILYNLTVKQGEPDKVYEWTAVDPQDWQDQMSPLLSLEQGITHQVYKAFGDHLVNIGHMVPPSTTGAEDVERKMLKSENEFLKELLHTITGTRKDESWRTTSMTDLSNKKLDRDDEMERREYPAGTPTISSGSGSNGHGSASGSSLSNMLSARNNIPSPKDIPRGGLPDDAINWGHKLDQAESRQGDSEDRGGL